MAHNDAGTATGRGLWTWAAVVSALIVGASCGGRVDDPRPDVLLVVWDTVRSDRMSVYGHERPTTPYLEGLAVEARVFSDMLAVAPTTAPSHASMFTGLLPREHLVDNNHPRLPNTVPVLPQLLAEAGYLTLLYSANPYLIEDNGFTRGFDRWGHPWDPARREAALAHVLGKIESAGQPVSVPGGSIEDLSPWHFKDSDSIARELLVEWLGPEEDDRPFFAVVNLMEAHTWRFPSAAHRRAVLGDGAAVSYAAGFDALTMAEYVFGLRNLDPAKLRIEADVYDASLAELDALTHDLIEAIGDLDRSRPLLVIVTSDHGEHLGEHHRLNHQFSLFRQVLEVPLLILDETGRISPGLDASPVNHLDVFATILASAGVPRPEAARGLDLGASADRGKRLASYTDPAERWIASALQRHSDFDPGPFLTTQDALLDGRWKLITWSDGRRGLFDLAADPDESIDRWAAEPALGARMMSELEELRASLDPSAFGVARPEDRDIGAEELERLRALGYAID